MNISPQVSDSRAALEELTSTAEAAAANWTTPRAPKKWSPAQVTEHVARVFDDTANMLVTSATNAPPPPDSIS